MRKTNIFRFSLFLLGLILTACSSSDEARYKNPNVPIDQRVEDLLGRMTLEEKFWQLFMIPGDLSDGKEKYKHGIFGLQVATQSSSGKETEQILNYGPGANAEKTAHLINKIQKYFVTETRLGIPIIPFDEALHGLIREDATAFPQSIGLAATWNIHLMDTVAASIAEELKIRGIRQNLSPVINIARDVRWGRVEETYGEDPFLTSKMAVSYISAFEKRGIIATPKHFVANVGDGGRDSYPIHFNPRILEEIYFPAFKASVQKGGARSIMTAYNSVDGTQASAHAWLLREKLKKEWSFKGIVISDAGATGGANVLHFTAKDYAESTQQAINGGLDVIFQTSYDHYPLFFEAFQKGMIDEQALDEAVRRVLRTKFELGLFENPYVEVNLQKNKSLLRSNKKIAKKAALQSLVLLKNEKGILPLKKDISSIAVIGPEANTVRLGGYSGPGNEPVSLLDGLKRKVKNRTKIHYALGCERVDTEFVTIPSSHLFHYRKGTKKKGLKASYFNNIQLKGQPALERVDPEINFQWTLFSPDPDRINYDFYSARWTGKLIAPETETIEIGLKGNDGYRLYIDGKLLIDNWQKQSFRQITQAFSFEKNKEYDLRIEFYESAGNARFQFIWNHGLDAQKWKKDIENAAQVAKNCEVALVCVGIEEGEFRDRASLALPGHQEELIQAIAQTGTPVVVLLVGGSAVTMHHWIDQVPAILDLWYPGEEGGNAVADVLFGDYNPGGKLPITFPLSEGQLPLYYNHKPSGRGDDYIHQSGKPLFPFGFGLSYTQFVYTGAQLSKKNIATHETTTLRVKIKNTGACAGDEVVQLYIRDEFSSVARPLLELKGFRRIHLKKGEEKELVFKITPDLLKMYNQKMQSIVEPGTFKLMIGSSSNDIRQRLILTVH